MLFDTNAFNRLRYTLWAPIYDAVVGRFAPLRRRAFARLGLRAGERVLLVGAGTGADLPFLREGARVVATDLTPAMLARARARGSGAHLAVMDGHALALPDAAFDAVVLHLILAVIPDPGRCLAEAARVLRPGGRIGILDKFLADETEPGFPRRIADVVAGAIATRINRRVGDILAAAGAPLRVELDEPAALGGFFRVLVLRKAA
jgi:ubiquinone/menaquinone biosynthesis C-methylase UbiE